MEKTNHKKLVFLHLRRYGSIDPMTALRDYGCYRLSARISELRREGYNIRTELVAKRSKVTGSYAKHARYYLED